MSVLVTIFNPNDPTPTAISIRTHKPEAVHILLVDFEHYKPHQRASYDRFKHWISGSMRSEGFPKHIWLEDLDWTSLNELGCEVVEHKLEKISDLDLSLFNSNTIIDFFSGTKEMAVTLMAEVQRSNGSPTSFTFTTTQINGMSVDISSGLEIPPKSLLTLRERIWLSTGKIAFTGSTGWRKLGEKIKNWPSFQRKGKTIPSKTKELARLLNLEGKSADFNDGYWLEEFASHVIATWPDVQGTWTQLHIIPAGWKEFVAAAMSKRDIDQKMINYPKEGYTSWPFGFEENGKRKFVKELDQLNKWKSLDQTRFFEENKFTDEQIKHVWSYAFVNDVDVVALLKNGFLIFVECKHRSQNKPEFSERINALSAVFSPRSYLPLLVQSSSKTELGDAQGIYVIKWPDLKNSFIGIDASSNRTISHFLPSTEKGESSNKKTPIKNISNEGKKEIERIGSLLESLDHSLQKNQHLHGIPWSVASSVARIMIDKKRMLQIFGIDKFSAKWAMKHLSDFVVIEGKSANRVVKAITRIDDTDSEE